MQDFISHYRPVAESLNVWVQLHLNPRLSSLIESEDVIQEVWCRAYQKFASYRPERGSFRAWVLGIAQNVLLEHLRQLHSRSRPAVALDRSPEAAAEMTSISERAMRSEAVAELLRLARGLPEIDRELVLLRGLEELPFAQVADRLGLSESAAQSRWRRVLAELRNCSVPLLD